MYRKVSEAFPDDYELSAHKKQTIVSIGPLGAVSDVELARRVNALITNGNINAVDVQLANVPNGYAGLDGTGKVALAQLPSGLAGGLVYLGVWNAATNTPALSSGSGPGSGSYYKVAVAGSTTIDGLSDWQPGDWIIFNGVSWDKIDNSELVLSVNGQTGVVTLTKSHVALSNVDNTSDLNKPISTAMQTALNNKVDTSRTINTYALNSNINLSTSDLADVLLSAPVNHHTLTFNSATGQWNNNFIALSQISDVALATPSNGQLLAFNGTSWVNTTPGYITSYALAGASDANITTPTNNQLLSYNGTKWVNITPSFITTLAGASDAQISSPATNQILLYNGTKWANVTPNYTSSLAGATDVTLTSPASGQLLSYNGIKWVNFTPSYITTYTLAGATDATITSPANNQILAFNSGTNKWENITRNMASSADVVISSPANNQVLLYNSGTSKWVNAAVPASNIASAGDVVITSPANNQVLLYNSGTSKWVNAAVPASNIASAGDVVISSPANNQVLLYNSGTSKWVNAASNIATASDVTISAPTNNQVLTYNSGTSKWVNAAVPAGNIANAGDVTITSPTNSQALTYNSGTSKWVNTSLKPTNIGTYGLWSTGNTWPTFSNVPGLILTTHWSFISGNINAAATINSTTGVITLNGPFPMCVTLRTTIRTMGVGSGPPIPDLRYACYSYHQTNPQVLQDMLMQPEFQVTQADLRWYFNDWFAPTQTSSRIFYSAPQPFRIYFVETVGSSTLLVNDASIEIMSLN